MPWWVLVALVLLGSVAWAFVQARTSLEGRKENPQRGRRVADVAREAVRGKKPFLSNRPLQREEPYHLTDAEFRIDRGE